MGIKYIDRQTKEIVEEKVAGLKYLEWLYQSPLGMGFLEVFLKRKVFSSIYGKMQDLACSKNKIEKFISEFQIDMSIYEKDVAEYKSFNDFFIRKLKKDSRPISKQEKDFISPADGKILVYEKIDIDKIVQIKGLDYRLGDLLENESLARKYRGGSYAIIRLAPTDYHRFHFPDSGFVEKVHRKKGQFYSVNPIALKKIKNLYVENKREVTEFQSDNFGRILYVEVGATFVGSILQTYKKNEKQKKGQEKGYFKFGGSTILLFLEEARISWDEDLLSNTARGLETQIQMGMKIGEKN